MKKLLLIAGIGIAGLGSAKGAVEKNINTEISTKEVKNLPPEWIKVEAPCGAVYWMQAGNYRTIAEFADAQQDFNDAKCN